MLSLMVHERIRRVLPLMPREPWRIPPPVSRWILFSAAQRLLTVVVYSSLSCKLFGADHSAPGLSHRSASPALPALPVSPSVAPAIRVPSAWFGASHFAAMSGGIDNGRV